MDLNGPTFTMKDNRRKCIVSLQTCKGLSIDPHSMVTKEVTYTLVGTQPQNNKSKVGGLRAIAKLKQTKVNEPKLDKLIDKNVSYLQKSLARNIDVLYNMQTLKSFVTKLKSAYNCDIDKCEGMQSRFHQHLLDCHPDYFDPQKAKGGEAQTNFSLGSGELVDGSVNTTQDDLKIITRPKIEAIARNWLKKVPFNPDEIPTEAIFREQKLADLITKITHKATSGNLSKKEFDDQAKADIDNFLDEIDVWYPGTKQDKAQFKEGLRELLHSQVANMDQNFNDDYTPQVEAIARDWLEKVPFNPDESPEEARFREQKLNDLINKVTHKKKSGNLSKKEFDNQVKADVDHFLDEIDVWYPGTEQDKVQFKEGLRELLHSQIADISQDFNDDFRPEVEAIARDWLNKVTFNPDESPEETRFRKQKLNDLINKVTYKKKSGNLSKIEFDNQVKADIDQFLDEIDVRYLGTEQNKVKFKEGLREQLHSQIDNIPQNFNDVPVQQKPNRRISFRPNEKIDDSYYKASVATSVTAPVISARRPSELKRIYKPKIEANVRDWIKKVHFSPFESPLEVNLREKYLADIINIITDKLTTERLSERDFENVVKAEIDQFLDKVNIWYQSSNRGKVQIKEGLREHLFSKVLQVYRKFFDEDLRLNAGASDRRISHQSAPSDSPRPSFLRHKASIDLYSKKPPLAGNYPSQDFGQNYAPAQNLGQNHRLSQNLGSELDTKFKTIDSLTQNQGDQRRTSVPSATANNPYQTLSFAQNVNKNYAPRPSQLSRQDNNNNGAAGNSQNYGPSNNINQTYGSQVTQDPGVTTKSYFDPNLNAQTSTPINDYVQQAQKRLSQTYGTGGKQILDKIGNSRRTSTNFATRDGPRQSLTQNPGTRPNEVINGMYVPIANSTQSYNQTGGVNQGTDSFGTRNSLTQPRLSKTANEGYVLDMNTPQSNLTKGVNQFIDNRPRKSSIKSYGSNSIAGVPTNVSSSMYGSNKGIIPKLEPPSNYSYNQNNINEEATGDYENQTNAADKYTKPINSNDVDYSSYVTEPKQCIKNERNDSYYDGPDLLGQHRRKIDKKRKSPSNTLSDPAFKCVVPSGILCGCPIKEKPELKYSCAQIKLSDIEQEICEWLKKSQILEENGLANRQEIIETLMYNIGPYLQQPSDCLNKAVLKAKIVDILNDLGLCSSVSGNSKGQILKFAGDLSNRLIGILSRLESTGGTSWKCNIASQRPYRDIETVRIGPNEVLKVHLRQDFKMGVTECLKDTPLVDKNSTEEDIIDVLLHRVELLRTGMHELPVKEIKFILYDTKQLSEVEVDIITDNIIQNAKDLLMTLNTINNRTQMNVTTSGTLSIYTSEHEIFPTYSSTFRKRRNVEKLSPAEISYVYALADVIRDWLKIAADIFKVVINQDLIETMTYELAGEIADYEKLTQLAHDSGTEKRSFMRINIYKWLLKFDMIQDVTEAEPYTQELVNALDDINVPDLISPYCSRQEIMRISNDKNWLDSSALETKNVLEDEIVKWMNEQTSNFVTDDDKNRRKIIHEFVKKIQPKLVSKKEKDVEKEGKNFVKKIFKSKDKKEIESLTNCLLEKIKKVQEDKNKLIQPDVLTANKERDSVDTNRTMKRYILKYIERISATDDPLTQGAYGHLLKTELLKLDADTITEKKEDSNKTFNEIFSPEKLNQEMDYVKDISDWLKNIPIEGSYNTVGNKDRIEFVISVAKNIVEVEDQRKLKPQITNYNNNFKDIISQFMEKLPVLPDQKGNVTLMIDQLQTKIDCRRNKTSQTVMNEIEHDIPGIIKVFVNIYGPDMADDELKLDIWTTRMLKEIQNKLAIERSTAPVSEWKRYVAGQDLIQRFQLELNFIPEVTDWLKNLPVIDTVDVTMITDLAEKMADYSSKLINDQEMKQCIEEFISKLKLDKQKDFDVSFVTQQLITRINNCKENTDSFMPKDVFKVSDTKIKPQKSKSKRSKSKQSNGSATTFVQIIEKWCEDLPIKGKQIDEIKETKNDIATKLYHKIGDLNDDPDANSDDLYKDVLTNELNFLLDNIPKSLKLDGSKDKLKQKLLDDLLEVRFAMRQSTAGDNYKQKLQNTLETSLPNPAALQDDSPGFELYKNHLTNMFLLDNFDEGSYASKLKYEKRIKNDIDTYFHDAQIRNAVPITKDQLYNHLYSSLYKVDIPNEIDLKKEVEKVKIKYVIEEWFEQLPIKLANGNPELLDRDQKIDVLTDKIYQAENEKATAEKKIKLIEKWLTKTSLLENAEDVPKHAQSLHQILESTENTRKCLIPSGTRKMSKEFGLFAGDEITNTKIDDTGIWINPNTNSELLHEQSVQKSGDMILDIVEQWCANLFLLPCTTQAQIQAIKDDIITKLTMKISELNSRPDIFQENQLYDHLLGQEIVKLLKLLVPQCSAVPQCEDALKNQLIVAINSVKPIIEEERARHEYKKDLENTINSFLQTSQLPTSAEAVVSASVKEDIINDFIEYQYNQDDEQGRLYYKIKILQAVLKYNMSTGQRKNLDEVRRNTVRKGNQLICELSKIPSPGNQAIKHEVEEIRMKHVVNEFFNKTYAVNPEKLYLQNLLANSLAKQLNDIEKCGYNNENEQKIKTAIARAAIRLNGESKDFETDALIQKLKETEKIRRACPPKANIITNSNSPSHLATSPVTKPHASFAIPCQRSMCFNTSISQSFGQADTHPNQPMALGSPATGDVVEKWSMTESGPQNVQQNVDYIVHQPKEQTPNAVVIQTLGDGQSVEVQMFDYGPQPNQFTPNKQAPMLKEFVSVYTEPNLESFQIEGPVYVDKGTDPCTKDVTINTGYYSAESVTDNSSDTSDSMRCLCDMFPSICDRDGSRPCSFYAPIMPMPFMAMHLPVPMQFPYMY